VEQRLELVATIDLDGADLKRELLHDVVDEIDGVGLRVTAVDLQRANSRGIVDRCVLFAPYRRLRLSLKQNGPLERVLSSATNPI
jgi:hypothetical protein